MKSPAPVHTPFSWHVITKDGRSFVYADKDTPVCVVAKQFSDEAVLANAQFIVRACNHHYELVRPLKAAAHTLTDGCDEHAWPGLGVSPTLAQEFCRQATETLHAVQKEQ